MSRSAPVASGLAEVLYVDADPRADGITAALRVAGYRVEHRTDPADVIQRMPEPDSGTWRAAVIDATAAPSSAAGLVAALRAADRCFVVLLVSRHSPVPFAAARGLPTLRRPFDGPELVRTIQAAIGQPMAAFEVPPSRVKTVGSDEPTDITRRPPLPSDEPTEASIPSAPSSRPDSSAEKPERSWHVPETSRYGDRTPTRARVPDDTPGAPIEAHGQREAPTIAEARAPFEPAIDTGDAPQAAEHEGTDPTDLVAPSRSRSAFGWFATGGAIAACTGLVVWLAAGSTAGSDPSERGASTPANPSAAVSEPDDLDPNVRALALLSERDPAQAPPFELRHRLLDRLAKTPDAARVDRRTQIILDLFQAGQSPTPCRTFANALDRIEADPDPSYPKALQRAVPPTSCEGLAARHRAVLEAAQPEPTEEATDEAASQADSASTAKPRRRHETRSRPKRKAAPKTGKKTESGKAARQGSVATKLDEDLHPMD